jgi:hypothetical protein
MLKSTMKLNPLLLAILALSRGADGDGGEGDTVDWGNEEQRNKAIQAVVDKSVLGLKDKNTELLGKLAKLKGTGENTELNALIESLGGADAAKGLLTMKTALEKDERTKKLLSGNISEIESVINSQTTAMKANYENKLTLLNKQLEEATGKVGQLTGSIQQSALRAEVDKACAGLACLSGVNDDVFREAMSVFKFNEKGQPVILDEGEVVRLGADGKTPMSVQEWLDSTRESSPYRWADSRGTGGTGSGGNNGKRNLKTDSMPMSQYRKERAAGNIQ